MADENIPGTGGAASYPWATETTLQNLLNQTKSNTSLLGLLAKVSQASEGDISSALQGVNTGLTRQSIGLDDMKRSGDQIKTGLGALTASNPQSFFGKLGLAFDGLAASLKDSKLGALAQILGFFAGGLVEITKRVDALSISMLNLYQSGIDTTGGMKELAKAASAMGLTSAELAAIMQRNATALVSIGTDKFYRVGAALDKATNNGLDFGLTMEQLQGSFLNYVDGLKYSQNVRRMSDAQLVAGYKEYEAEIQRMTELTGKNREQLEQSNKSFMREANTQLLLLSMPETMRDAIAKGLQNIKEFPGGQILAGEMVRYLKGGVGQLTPEFATIINSNARAANDFKLAAEAVRRGDTKTRDLYLTDLEKQIPGIINKLGGGRYTIGAGYGADPLYTMAGELGAAFGDVNSASENTANSQKGLAKDTKAVREEMNSMQKAVNTVNDAFDILAVTAALLAKNQIMQLGQGMQDQAGTLMDLARGMSGEQLSQTTWDKIATLVKNVAPALGIAMASRLPGLASAFQRAGGPPTPGTGAGGTTTPTGRAPPEEPRAGRALKRVGEAGTLDFISDLLKSAGYGTAGNIAGMGADTLFGAGLGELFGVGAKAIPGVRKIPLGLWSKLGGIAGAGYGAMTQGGELMQNLLGQPNTTESVSSPIVATTGQTDPEAGAPQVTVTPDVLQPETPDAANPFTLMVLLLRQLHTDMEDLNLSFRLQTEKINDTMALAANVHR